jgi:CelD/BcsL family acetyltransferase involved in cellulose biosynthesis
MNEFRVRRWTSEEFRASREAWQSLLARADADPLFMSWDWVSAWWRHHESALSAELCVLAIHSPDGGLAGIAPFYEHRAVHRGILSARRLELLGNTWRNPAAVFSEYLDVIAGREVRADVCGAVADWLRTSSEWDELALCNVRENSVAAQLADSLSGCAYVRCAESMTGWCIALPDSFDSFVTRLSSNTRRKVVHQREKLAGASFERVEPAQTSAALKRLDAFVAQRFGTPAGEASRLRAGFHDDVAASVDSELVHLTELRSAGLCVSVMLNLRVGATEYYLQSGFDPAFARGLSPGLLHLGYAIEAACRDGVSRFDFLAGRGLHRDYKQDFSAESAPLHTLHIVRKPALRALFRVVDGLRGRTSHKARVGR